LMGVGRRGNRAGLRRGQTEQARNAMEHGQWALNESDEVEV
jgi:hypothetical protein